MSKKTGNALAMEAKPDHRPKVYIAGGGLEYIRLMFNLGCDGAKNVEEADVVVFTGGEDVNPELYGEVPLAKTFFNRMRDERDTAVFDAALKKGIPMVGICRGGQFLNVRNGGKMWQHVGQHTISHLATVEIPPFHKGNRKRIINVTSTHHQMMIPTDEAIILLTASEALEKISPDKHIAGKNKDDPDIEAVFYDDTNCLCFQPHPEFATAPPDCVDFFEECLDNFIFPRIPKHSIAADVVKPAQKQKKGK